MGHLLSGDRGFGFRIRSTATDIRLLENWQDLLAWWMQVEGAESPEPQELRAWQRFIADNLEFRMGVAIGAVIAQAWSDGAEDPLEVPSLKTWRDTTGLPWFGFWARELLRWGTLDPFVAFAMAQSLAPTRRAAADRRPEFKAWLQQEYEELNADDLISPQLFQEWQQSLPRIERERPTNDPIEVELTGTTGQRELYDVIPVQNGDYIKWIDASGYELAKSQFQPGVLSDKAYRQDFELTIFNGSAIVQRTFAA